MAGRRRNHVRAYESTLRATETAFRTASVWPAMEPVFRRRLHASQVALRVQPAQPCEVVVDIVCTARGLGASQQMLSEVTTRVSIAASGGEYAFCRQALSPGGWYPFQGGAVMEEVMPMVVTEVAAGSDACCAVEAAVEVAKVARGFIRSVHRCESTGGCMHVIRTACDGGVLYRGGVFVKPVYDGMLMQECWL